MRPDGEGRSGLFRELADEYQRRARGELAAEPIQQAESSPSLVPVVADVPIVADAPPTGDVPVGSFVPIEAEAPLAPAVPASESDQFVAGLRTLREETVRES